MIKIMEVVKENKVAVLGGLMLLVCGYKMGVAKERTERLKWSKARIEDMKKKLENNHEAVSNETFVKEAYSIGLELMYFLKDNPKELKDCANDIEDMLTKNVSKEHPES